MDPVQLYTASRLVIVAGKGGVGKTTVSASLAVAAAQRGLSALLVEVEGKSGLATMFAAPPLGAEPTALAEGVRGVRVTPEAALAQYLREHGMGRLTGRLVRTGVLDVVATAAPGIEDILVLGKVKQLERAAAADLIVLDAPAAGHAVAFLQSAHGLLDAVGVGPINSQARDVVELLGDPERCQVVLVTLAEETPVTELVDTAFALEERVGVSLGPVVVNGLWDWNDKLAVSPANAVADAGVVASAQDLAQLAVAADLRRARVDLQRVQLERLTAALPLPQVHLPQLFTTSIGPSEVAELAALLDAGIVALPT